ncbi:MAG: hypothetical protein FJ056_09155 [Cyanobacteria bacterium M_surface_10_m2_179]|nr:hypothetical protein [Cyanobacteria bacterium M_surface_10_m2_179]
MTDLDRATQHQAGREPASERITEQLGRLIPLVNGPTRVARVGSTHGRAGLPSLLSWDADGQLNVD